jgi:hypothetical protein
MCSDSRALVPNVMPLDAPEAMSKGATDFWVKGQIDFTKLRPLIAAYIALPAA